MSLDEIVNDKDIKEVVHFTTNRGVIGALHEGCLLSRPLLNEESYLRHVLQLNSVVRPEESALFDKTENWLRFVNLSISEVNRRFLDVSRRWHTNSDVWWCILAFDAEVIGHDGVWFATTNNGYADCRRAQGEEGFGELFTQEVLRKAVGSGGKPWYAFRDSRPANLPTCEQAEVLYPEKLSLDYLRTIYVEEDQYYDTVVGWLREFGYTDVEVIVGQQKFIGRPN